MKTRAELELIENRIYCIRGQRVMLSVQLSRLYGVETRTLNQAVKRNRKRFPADFTFRLNHDEAEWLVSQNVIPHRKYLGGSLPYAFTEQGIAMLSGILNSDRAIQVNIAIMRAFVRLKTLLQNHKELEVKLTELEKKVAAHDTAIISIFEAIRQLIQAPVPPTRRIGFLIPPD